MNKLHVFFLLSLVTTQAVAETVLMKAVTDCHKERNSLASLNQLTVVLGGDSRFDESDDGMTPLYYAVMTRNEEVLGLLLNRGKGDVNYRLNSDDESIPTYTALMKAVEIGSELMVAMLLNKGANPHVISYASVVGNNDDSEEVAQTTPLEWARAKGDRPQIVRLLESVKVAA